MAGGPIESLEELLTALGRERGLRGRLRVIGRAWKLLRMLSPLQREQVAIRMGSSLAWRRLEKSFLRDGQMSDSEQLVGRIFERMGDSEPGELRKLAKELGAGDTEGLRDTLMVTLGEALEEEASEEENGKVEAESAPASSIVPDEEPEQLRADEVEESAPAADLSVAEPAPALPKVESRPEPPALQSIAPEPPNASVASAPTETLAPVAREIAVATGVDRLHALRTLTRDGAASMNRRDRVRLIESLGGGWASRRALSQMIARRSLDDSTLR